MKQKKDNLLKFVLVLFSIFLISACEKKDINGMVLDGDEDGVAGGNYVLSLYIIG